MQLINCLKYKMFIFQKQKDDLPPSRIVFDVALEGKARKLVTVRSALLIVNKLNENLEIKLESQLPTEAGLLIQESYKK